MSKVTDLLPKMVKFKKHGVRRETMAISLPQNKYAPTYINARLGRHLVTKDINAVEIMFDKEQEAIALVPSTGEDAFTISRVGTNGVQLNAKLGQVMDCGRYIFVPEESDDKTMMFRLEHTSFKAVPRRKKNGKVEATTH